MTSVSLESVRIEVVAKEGDSSTQRGALLESLGARVLAAMQCTHVSTNVRVTGMEVDVIGEDSQTGERILVECKAYRDQTIPADTIVKLYGQVSMFNYSSGWLLTTSELGKDAKGIREEFRGRPESERKKLRLYDPKELVSLLISTGQIISPRTLSLPDDMQVSPTPTLLITDIGQYWAVVAIGSSSGIADTVLVYDATSGKQIRQKTVVKSLSERDSRLKELTWLSSEDDPSAAAVVSDTALKRELDSIAPVPVADTWSDYRPARPEDFVGRDDRIREILSFLDDVRTDRLTTRLLAIKAPSGWGKSSFLNKLRSLCSSMRYRGRFFLYAVDCRTAISARYPELALKRCLDEALSTGFVPTELGPISVGSAGDPFSASSTRSLLEYLRREKKVVVLFFDQFEEITTREEFEDLFNAIKAMCSAIDSAQENVVLGFSWKTDGAIPTDHPAYYIWHRFGDRRREFDLPLFSAADISKLLGGLVKELKHAIDPTLRRLLTEQCQGYPWLLKKLCIHVFGALRSSPTKQRELLERALDVDALFQKDLVRLPAIELECVKRIARDSPADFYTVENTFGAYIIGKLINQRLVVRNGAKLILYWDIFREYVLTGRAPKIPSRYVPVNGPGSAKPILAQLNGQSFTSLRALSRKSSYKIATLDNIARDLVMMGVAQYNRKEQRIRLVANSPVEIVRKLFTYASTHLVYKGLTDKTSTSPAVLISVSDVVEILKTSSAGENFAPTTWTNRAHRMLLWMEALGLIRWEQEERIVLVPNPVPPRSLEQLGTRGRSRRGRPGRPIFKADAPPNRVLELVQNLLDPGYKPTPEDRNSLAVLRSLGLISSTAEPALIERPGRDPSVWLAAEVLSQSTFRAAWHIYRNNPDAPAVDIGRVIEERTGQPLAVSSRMRYGNGLQVWIRWVNQLVRERASGRNTTDLTEAPT